ncbi:putative pheromone-regulated membrane protein [Clavispora lusitaniae]|uniref:Threonine/serine exporter-like N-terminal domain-containing protein n=2 Tax=Clavispora lusitaniae TaxID=36911 RepID=C4YCK1_CLAL4|nr:uncharacterized protein CLUG_05929 [Clavispora lusitaniae ATCC 42720]KAF5208751.1 hypothetical protein E0198_005259 [Clavispora lusitaniae]EEQ41801.1 hypothetical protein CLUG_05929 [Clavispora lusitaniae ATCC 42720]KAF7580427.1 hypothetical protein FOB63_004365 [Clavispora lusitaniae]QFZ30299.1 putative pheromone-regulated membrane protein [Clavispora lusitaniae]QFZ35961.1 putative pheromone-regulated membrane protein [Clavispora lusitaniae]
MSDLSSSDDEAQYKPKISVPTVNLANLRKKNQKSNAKDNLAKARKKFTSHNKSVRFPDNPTRPASAISNSSNMSSFSSELDSDHSRLEHSDDDPTPEGSSKDLPHFSFKVPYTTETLSSEDDEDINSLDMQHVINPSRTYNEESSDEGEYAPQEYHESASPKRRQMNSDAEADVTDLHRQSSGSRSVKSGESEKKGFKNIFRKMSLADSMEGDPGAPSRSDTFLGRVLSFSGGGLSGGGLAPGASHAESGADDEEKRAGGMPEDHNIEMQRLDFAQLNDEAQNLISLHVPETSRRKMESIPEVDPNDDSTALLMENEEKPTSTPPDATPSSHTGTFYQPNPDLVRENANDDYHEEDIFENDTYVAPPKQVHAGVLSSLLKLYQNEPASKSSTTLGSGLTTLADEQSVPDPYSAKNTSTHDFTQLKSNLRHGPRRLANKFTGHKHKRDSSNPPDDFGSESDEATATLDGDAANLPSFQNARPKAPRPESKVPQRLGRKFKKRQDQKLRITVHIADILQRQRFIIRMCRALMLYGAPTHRLEEYMVMTSRVLEIDGQFVYFPGTMIVAFGDAATRTSEVHLVRCAQGLNLSKLSDTHKIYKDVIHDLTGVEEAIKKLEALMSRKNMYSPWVCVFLYGIGSASVCTWSFGGGWWDVPTSFAVGLCIGYLQFIVSSKSNLYSSFFEVAASIVVSFISRAIGSIRGGSGNLFCFGAIAQGSLALILPGYIILCGSLELQAKNLVAGSVRMFYAIIYSLFLGFGITLGAALYGWVDKNATDAAQCPSGHSIDDKWRILFVPLFSLVLGLINQARYTQLPIMILISSIAYIGTYFAGKHFSNVTEFTAAIGAFIIGILGNMYSRVGRGMAVSAMLPAIFVQVPSGIASKSTLLAGVNTANKITNSTKDSSGTTDLSSLSFGATMVEVSIGISVGLFAAALVVYPFGKRRTGLFTL